MRKQFVGAYCDFSPQYTCTKLLISKFGLKVRARMQLDLHGIIGQPALHFPVSYVLFTQLHMTNREQVLHRCALHIHTGWLTDLS